VTLGQIAVLIGLAVGIGRFRRGRVLAMLAVSTAVLFWLQPAEPIAMLGFLLPLGVLGLTVVSWVVTSERRQRKWQDNWPAIAVMAGVVLIVALGSGGVLSLNGVLVAPTAEVLVGALGCIAVAAALLWGSANGSAVLPGILAGLIVVLFVLVKTSGAAEGLLTWAQQVRGAESGLDPGIAFSVLGCSYVAFRILHTIRDRQSGRLPSVDLGEYATYVIFFPAFVA